MTCKEPIQFILANKYIYLRWGWWCTEQAHVYDKWIQNVKSENRKETETTKKMRQKIER